VQKDGAQQNAQSSTGRYAAAGIVCHGVSVRETNAPHVGGGGKKGWEKWHGALPEPFPAFAAATPDRELSPFELRKATQKGDSIHLTHAQKEHPLRRRQQATHPIRTPLGRRRGSLQ